MAITSLLRDWADGVSIVRMVSTNTLAEVGTTGYLLAQASNIAALNNGPFEWVVSDMVLVYASDGWGFFQIDPDFESLIPFVFGGSVVGAPVTVGDFAVFQSTSGNLEDLGYLPSNSAKTRVVMAGSAVVANHIALFQDTTGTIDDTAATAINNGSIQAGLSGTAGTLISYPAAATNGHMIIAAVGNAGNFNLTVSSISSLGQSSVVTVPDPGVATSSFLLADSAGTQSIATGSLSLALGSLSALQGNLQAGSSGHAGTVSSFPGTAANGSIKLAAINNSSNKILSISNAGTLGQDTVLNVSDAGLANTYVDQSQSGATSLTNKVFVKTITATAAALATSGHVAVMAAPSGTSQFKIMNIRVMYAAAGLSGGGGDRLLTLTDGTIVFNQAGITAALLGTPIWTLWGGTGNPIPATVSTVSTAGAAIYLVYSGGAADYTTGQIVVEVELAQVTA